MFEGSDAQPNPQLAAWAQANGWGYRPTAHDLATRWHGEPFSRSHVGNYGLDAVQVINGGTPVGWQFCSFTFRYTFSMGHMTQDHYSWVVALRLPAPLPALSVFPRMLQSSGSSHFTTGNELFDQQFLVETGDPNFASRFLQPPVENWLLGPGQAAAPFRVDEQDLLWWRPDNKPNYNLLPAVLTLLDYATQALMGTQTVPAPTDR